jgi:hypothetical protein
MKMSKPEETEVKGRDWKQIARYFQYAIFVASMILSGVLVYFLLNMEEIYK